MDHGRRKHLALSHDHLAERARDRRLDEPIARISRHSGAMRLRFRPLWVVAPVLLVMPMIPRGQAAGAVTLPRAAVIEVTGYDVVAEAGSRGPVTETVTGSKERELRSALQSSHSWTKTAPRCLDVLQPFVIDLLPHRGARPAMVVTAYDTCDGQYPAVTIGRTTIHVTDACALELAVVEALPHGQARGTRELVSDSCGT